MSSSDADEGLEIRERAQLARAGGRAGLARRPRHAGPAARHERRLDARQRAGRRRRRDCARLDAHVRRRAGQLEHGADAAGGRHRNHEGRASRREIERRPPLERNRERARPADQRDARLVLADEGQRFVPEARVEQRRAGHQRHLGDTAPEDFPFQRKRAGRAILGHADAQIAAREHGGDRRRIGRTRGALRQVQQASVLGKRQRHGAGGRRRVRRALGGGDGGGGETGEQDQ